MKEGKEGEVNPAQKCTQRRVMTPREGIAEKPPPGVVVSQKKKKKKYVYQSSLHLQGRWEKEESGRWTSYGTNSPTV